MVDKHYTSYSKCYESKEENGILPGGTVLFLLPIPYKIILKNIK